MMTAGPNERAERPTASRWGISITEEGVEAASRKDEDSEERKELTGSRIPLGLHIHMPQHLHTYTATSIYPTLYMLQLLLSSL